MSSERLIRWGGLSALLAGVLLIIIDLIALVTANNANLSATAITGNYWHLTSALALLSVWLLLVGLISLYARQLEAAGLLGLLGFLIAFLGTVLVAGTIWANTFVAPAAAVNSPQLLEQGSTGTLALGFTLSFWVTAVGWLLFGIATLRARIYPRTAAVFLILGAALLLFPVPGVVFVFEAAVAALGLALFSGRGISADEEPEQQNSPFGNPPFA